MTEPAAEQPARAHIVVSGRVQGVGYRAFAHRVATAHGLVGGVRNLDDGRVELDVEGPKAAIEAAVLELKVGPPAGRVTKIETEWKAAMGRFSAFSIWYEGADRDDE
jgi:acylphosphatase